MHICLDITANFEGYELFERQFDCMRMGSDGVKIVKPEDGGGLPGAPGGVEADIDAGGPDEIGEYDEVVG